MWLLLQLAVYWDHFIRQFIYKTVLYIRQWKGGPQKRVVSKQKYIDCIEKWPQMVIFLYNLYIFGLGTTLLLANMVVALDPSNIYIYIYIYLYHIQPYYIPL